MKSAPPLLVAATHLGGFGCVCMHDTVARTGADRWTALVAMRHPGRYAPYCRISLDELSFASGSALRRRLAAGLWGTVKPRRGAGELGRCAKFSHACGDLGVRGIPVVSSTISIFLEVPCCVFVVAV